MARYYGKQNQIRSENAWLSPKTYSVNLILYVLLPCSAIFTAIYLFVQMTKTSEMKQFVCKEYFMGDGHCQDAYNVPACQFDLGDCCLPDPATKLLCKYCNCFDVSGMDDTSPNTIRWDFTTNMNCPHPEFVGDGFCDDDTNNYLCGYDGGDCCVNFILVLFCSSCECNIDKSKFQSLEICQVVEKIGNLVCNDEANLHTCNYDGGDCCLSHVNRDFCQNCICHEDLKQHPSVICPEENAIGNQICDPINNITSCNYDGGDCIDVVHERYPIARSSTNKFTSVELETTTLGIFQSRCKSSFKVGDGFCHDENNIDACDYDGGDCCLPYVHAMHCIFCKCHISNTSFVDNFYLIGCLNTGVGQGNGICEDSINTPHCNFDDGDCCGGSLAKCDRCLCHEDFPSCWFFTWIKDGVCDDLANNEICGYDGGDCCLEMIDNTFCRECFCYEDKTHHPAYEVPPCRLSQKMGDGKCQDEVNTESCNFDHGDCCKEIIIDAFCKLCICHEDLKRHMGVANLPDSCITFQVMDGVCDDQSNKAECAFDGGDCCLPIIYGSNCNICMCKEDNTKHPMHEK